MVFYLKYGNSFPELSAKSGTMSLFMAFRYDIAIAAFVCFAPLLIDFVGKPWAWATSRIMYIVYAGATLTIELIDLVYYGFNRKRLTTDIFAVTSALKSVWRTIIFEYWLYFCAVGLVFWFLYYFENKLRAMGNQYVKEAWYKKATFVLLCLISILIMARGGWQNRPIGPLTAIEYIEPQLVPLAMNSTFSFANSIVRRTVPVPDYYTREQALQIFNPKKQMQSPTGPKRNIVILLMESFGREHSGFLNTYYSPEKQFRGPKNKADLETALQTQAPTKGHYPYLDSLMQKSTVFVNAYANGRRSNQGLVSVFAGLPDLIEDPFMHSAYAGNRFVAIPSLLNKISYQTTFINGSSKGLLAWNEFIHGAGYQNYLSREDYNNDQDYDGGWGIFDHNVFTYAANNPIHEKQPFFTVAFSLSSHHPFTIPKALQERFSKAETPYLNSLEYADFAIETFFAHAKTKDWYKNTIFIILADHTFGAGFSNKDRSGVKSFYQNRLGLFSIPLVIYDPQNEQFDMKDYPVAHTDLLPTILRLANYSGDYFSYGHDLFQESDHYVVHYVDGLFHALHKDYLLLFDGTKTVGFYNYKADPSLAKNLINRQPEEQKEIEKYLKAYIQIYYDGLANNRLAD
ncbi:MAG: LTA synthase family protein [Pseudobdellovibrionaceae bacterium]